MSAADFIRYVTDAFFVAIFVFVARRAIRHPTRTSADTALFFGVLAFAVAGPVIIAALDIAADPTFGVITSAGVMALPFLLLRLVHDFAGVPRYVMVLAFAGLVLSIAALATLRPLPVPATLALVGYFAFFTVYCAVAFAREAQRSHGVNRRRLQSISAGSYVLGLLILLAGVSAAVPALSGVLGAATQLLALVWALAYAAGFAPPSPLRRLWQEPELRAFLARAATLPRLANTDDVVRELERGAGAALGASAQVSLADASGTLYFRQARAPEPFPVGPGSTLPARRAFDEQRTIFLEDLLQQDPANSATYRGRVVNSVIIAPITAGDLRLGVLMIHAPRAPLFATDDAALTRLLADQAAVILESRTLIDEAARVTAREEATRLKDDFLSAAAHDLKTPLTTLRGQTQLMLRKADRDPEAPADRVGLARLEAASERLGTLVEELLDASRIDQAQLALRTERLDLAELAREVSGWDRPSANPVEFGSDGVTLVGLFDRVRMTQVLENLIENAIKYSPAGTAVGVRTWREGDEARIAVSDHGIGISADDVPHVFERFRRGANVDDRRFAGMGLGLYIVAGIVAQHRGRIWVESALGAGSTFHVAVPLTDYGVPE